MGKLDKEKFLKEIERSYPSASFEILFFEGFKKPLEIKCKKCGEVYHYKKAISLFEKTNFCKCSVDFKNSYEKIEYLSKKVLNSVLFIDKKKREVLIQCKKCGEKKKKTFTAFFFYPDACNCEKKVVEIPKQELQKRLNNAFKDEYLLLSSNGANGEALIKHLNCGFCFKIKCFSDILTKRNRGCPKCYQFKSCGEKRIMDFLVDNKINFVPQKTFSPLNKSKYRFDFFLPDYNLAIEYQGEQHYRDNGFFKDGLNVIQKRDQVKREYCSKNNIALLEIPYTKLKEIPKIISSRLNDYPTGVGASAHEANNKEDIV